MEILVSVYMTTYYHEKYVKKAIDSILNQKTNFEYEIVISDDCSKDNTVEILKEYERKYDFIKVNYNNMNVGLTRNIFIAKSMCKGKYVTPLSGDDYWIDELKLQKQVEFLEKYPNYVGVSTVLEERVDDHEIGVNHFPKTKRLLNKAFTLDMFLKGHNCPLSPIMTKNFLLNEESRELFSKMPEVSSFIDDVTDSIFILKMGDVFLLSDVTVAYRVRRSVKTDKNFNSLNKGLLNYERHIDMLNNLDEVLRQDSDIDLLKRYVLVVTNGLIKSIMYRKINAFREKYNTIPKKYRERNLFIRCLAYCPKEIANALNIRIHENLNVYR